MGYREAVSYLDALGIDSMKSLRPSTQRIEALCEALDHPERAVPAIHLTGTNGKTSTARIASSLLTAAGLSVVTFTSPHLQSVRERLSLGGEAIGTEAFTDLFEQLRPYVELVEKRLDQRVTYFEWLMAMFFLWASEGAADVAVIEVGLGGRWDATNVVDAPVAAITNVGLDHTKILGADRATIAREKVGIIKEGATVVTAERAPDIVEIIEKEVSDRGAELSLIDRDFALTDNRVAFGGRYLSVRTSARDYSGLFVPLHGRHQAMNAAVALEAVTRFLPHGSLDDELIGEGISSVDVSGRVETVRKDGAPTIVLDVAHNPEGMSALITTLSEAFAFERALFVVGILSDKDHLGILSEIARVPARVIFTQAMSARATPMEDLEAAAREIGLDHTREPRVAAAVERAMADAVDGDLICITGSHYVVGEARDHLVGPLDEHSPSGGRDGRRATHFHHGEAGRSQAFSHR